MAERDGVIESAYYKAGAIAGRVNGAREAFRLVLDVIVEMGPDAEPSATLKSVLDHIEASLILVAMAREQNAHTD